MTYTGQSSSFSSRKRRTRVSSAPSRRFLHRYAETLALGDVDPEVNRSSSLLGRDLLVHLGDFEHVRLVSALRRGLLRGSLAAGTEPLSHTSPAPGTRHRRPAARTSQYARGIRRRNGTTVFHDVLQSDGGDAPGANRPGKPEGTEDGISVAARRPASGRRPPAGSRGRRSLPRRSSFRRHARPAGWPTTSADGTTRPLGPAFAVGRKARRRGGRGSVHGRGSAGAGRDRFLRRNWPGSR